MHRKIPSFFKNKYFLIILAFLIWMLFFDRDNLINQIKLIGNLKELRREKKYYLDEIKKDSITTIELMTSRKNIERFAREKFLMKKDNEDIFLIIDEKQKKK